MTITERIQEVFTKVHANMRYEFDIRQFGKQEYWKSWAKEINEGQTNIKDDCDGYALTMAEMLVEAGVEKQHIAIAYCIVQDEGHLVCKVFNSDNNNWYIMDNNVNKPTLRSQMGRAGYKWVSCMYLSDPGVWVEDK